MHLPSSAAMPAERIHEIVEGECAMAQALRLVNGELHRLVQG